MVRSVAVNNCSPSLLPKNSSWPARGTPKRQPAISCGGATGNGCACRANGSAASKPDMACNTVAASLVVSAKIERQSRERHAGTAPRVLTRPRVGFNPTTLLNAAGTRPDPAVSVPKAKLTKPAATATAEPELEPPEIYPSRNTLHGAPYGD